MPDEKIQLNEEQRTLILNLFNGQENPPSITDLVKAVFPNVEGADGRSKFGHAIKTFLAENDLQAVTTTVYKPKNKVELEESQKEFVKNNAQTMSPVEIARTLFNNPILTNLNQETRSVSEYIKELGIQRETSDAQDDVPSGSYKPPKTIEGALKKVDKYVFSHSINKNSMTAQQRVGLEALLAYMNTYRFSHQINLYENQTNRDLFESSFVRFTYDKPDLTEEEVDQYIMLSHEVVNSNNIQRRVERLQSLMDDSASNAGEDRVRISMTLVESINTLQVEHGQSVTRSQKLLGDLKQKRSDRIAEQRSANASILNLVQLWKEEKTRKKMLHLTEARKKEVKQSFEELASMSEVKARILGLNPDFVLNG